MLCFEKNLIRKYSQILILFSWFNKWLVFGICLAKPVYIVFMLIGENTKIKQCTEYLLNKKVWLFSIIKK